MIIVVEVDAETVINKLTNILKEEVLEHVR